MNDAQIVALIKEMLQSDSIGLFPHPVRNGGDSIVCPACRQFTSVDGNVSGMHGLKEGNHYDGCQLMKLVEAIESGASDEEIIDRTRELIGLDAIGLYGRRVNHDGDFIACPACSRTKDIQGDADLVYPLDAEGFEHAADCQSIELADAIKARS